MRGLVLARSGQTMRAQLVLGKLYAAGEIDPETLGILARTWMDRYIQSGDQHFLLKSRDLYRQAFEACPTDYYTGINAASKSLLAGEKETAAQLAARVQKVVGDKPVVNDYWMTATAAELQLLQSKFPEAAALYRAAVVIRRATRRTANLPARRRSCCCRRSVLPRGSVRSSTQRSGEPASESIGERRARSDLE